MTGPEINQRFVLVDDGLWMYHLGEVSGRSTPVADGEPMEKLRSGWWAADHEAAEITIRTRLSPTTIGYKLAKLSAESPMFPATLTPQEYGARREDEDFLSSLYDRVTEERPDQVDSVDGPWVQVVAALPPEGDERKWVAQLGPALRNRPEFLHLFPGYFQGFKEHVRALADAHPHKEYAFVDYKNKSGVTVILQVPFDKPQTEYRPALNQDGSHSKTKAGRTVQVKARRELLLQIPDRIHGATRAEAVAEWDRRAAECQQILDDARVAACSECRGHGYVIPAAEQSEQSAKVTMEYVSLDEDPTPDAADVLNRAAAKFRVAAAAVPAASAGTESWEESYGPDGSSAALLHHADWIALMSPDQAEPLALWLDSVAASWPKHDPHTTTSQAVRERAQALVIARKILREGS